MSNPAYPSTMKAILITRFGPPEVLQIQDVPTPSPQENHVIIRIKAFGINHAEMHMRRGEWAEWMPVSGIECVGTIASSPDPNLPPGTPVAALMGGLGRTINGSYAEYTRAAISNVVKLASSEEELLGLGLSWAQVAALPETYATAWTALFRNLEIKSGQKLLVRGGTSSFGRAAINLAVQGGAVVTATTRKEDRFQELTALGAKEVMLENANLSQSLAESHADKFDAILELVGNSTILDSLKMVRRGGRVCLAGFLGGLAPIADFNPLLQMASGVHFSFFGSFVFGTPEFALSDVPLTDVIKMVADKKFGADPAKVFKFEEIQEAHRLMEESQAGGKMVVVVE